VSTFAPESPVSVSLLDEPVRFSIPESVSVPPPPVFCALALERSTVTPLAASE